MGLLDNLLKVDNAAAFEPETKKLKSKRLKKILSSEEDVEITIKELPYKRLSDLMAKQFDKKGNFDFSASIRTKAIIAAEGIVEPNLKSEELREHFGCATPAELAEKLFGMELSGICDEISTLSGLILNEEEAQEENEEIKNF